MNFSYPVLVCDIGGTNVRLAAAATPGAQLGPVVHCKTAEHQDFAAAIEAVLPQFSPRPRSLVACAAGPLDGRSIKLTNAAWNIDGVALADRFGFAQGLLLNDFEAQALSLVDLPRGDWVPIGAFVPRHGTQLILGCGTGLGVAGLAEVGGRFLALPSEAGHMDFGPVDEEEEAIWHAIETGSLARVSAEMLLSGPGLVRLHRARLSAKGKESGAMSEPSAIAARALADPTGEEARSIRLFLNLLARFAGDLALAFLARGGVTFSGGILPKFASLLYPDVFRAAFQAKAPHHVLLREIGTRLIASEAVVLAGMARLAERPDLYAIDYAGRAWRQTAQI